jgi:benzoyl-CoA reductase/2-hydroxyglutaryl-CoA dehydratase subunit BcrC/BadD/HgdB
MWEERLAAHLKERPAQLRAAKKKGIKIVGYFPGNYVPEELIVASGAVPVCLIEGGDKESMEASFPVMPDIFCPFARNLVGKMLLKTDPYFELIDMLIAPITCQHLKKAAEICEYQRDIEIFKLGVPHQSTSALELEYFLERLMALRERLQAITGNEITDEKIEKAIKLYNRMREYISNISMMRCSSPPPLDGLDFIKLNHASFIADPVYMVDMLGSIQGDLTPGISDNKNGGVRLMLIGPNISDIDYDLLKIVREVGGHIVIEDIYEGIRQYRKNIKVGSDPLRSLAEYYLLEREVPPAFMRYSSQKRLKFALKQISYFNVSAIIWYELLCCETYDAEAYFFSKNMEEQNIPMLVLESDYGMAGDARTRTRLEAFIELVKGGEWND